MVHQHAQHEHQQLLAEIAGGASTLTATARRRESFDKPAVFSDFDAEVRARLAARTTSALEAAANAIEAERPAIESVEAGLDGWRELPHGRIVSLAREIEALRDRLAAAGVPGAEQYSWCSRGRRGGRRPPRRSEPRERITTSKRVVSWEARQLSACTDLVAGVDLLASAAARLRSSSTVGKRGRLREAVKAAKAAALQTGLSYEAPGLVQAVGASAPGTRTTDALLPTIPTATSGAGSDGDSHSSSPARRGDSPSPPPPPPSPGVEEGTIKTTEDWREKQRALAARLLEQRVAAVAAADSADQLVASAVADTAAAALAATRQVLIRGLDVYDTVLKRRADTDADEADAGALTAAASLADDIRAENCTDLLAEALEAITIATGPPLWADSSQCDTEQLTRQARLSLRQLEAELAWRRMERMEQDRTSPPAIRGLTAAEVQELELLQRQRLEQERATEGAGGWGAFDPRQAPRPPPVSLGTAARVTAAAAATGVYAVRVPRRAVEGRTAAALVLQRFVRGYQVRHPRCDPDPQPEPVQVPEPVPEPEPQPELDVRRPCCSDLNGEHAEYWAKLDDLRCYQGVATKYITTLRRAIAENEHAAQAMPAADDNDAASASAAAAVAEAKALAEQKRAYFQAVVAHCSSFAARCNDTNESYMIEPDMQALGTMETFLKNLVRTTEPPSRPPPPRRRRRRQQQQQQQQQQQLQHAEEEVAME
jgi:hypothetical protein